MTANRKIDLSAHLGSNGKIGINSDEFIKLKLTLTSDITNLERDWRQLQKQVVDAPFQDFDWTTHLFKHASEGPGQEPIFVSVLSDNVLEAIFPLIKKEAFGITGLSWLAQEVNAINGPLALPSFLNRLNSDRVGEFWKNIIYLVGGIDYLFLDKQPENLGGYPNPFFNFNAQSFTARSYAILLTDDWDAFYRRKISPKNRRNFKRKLRRLKELGTVSFEKAESPDDKQRVINDVLNWKSHQLDQRGAPNPFSKSEFSKYFDFAESDVIGKPILQTYSLNLSGKPIAAALGFLTSEQFIGYQLAMKNCRAQKYSPGMLLQKHMIKDSISRGCKRFDLSVGDDSYKLKWADETNDISQSLKSYSIPGMLFVVVVSIRTRIKRLIKSRPLLMLIVYFLNFHWTRIKRSLMV